MKISKLRAIILCVLVLFIVSACAQQEKKAKYVFLFIGDGMGFSHVALTEGYLATKEGKIGSNPLRFTQFPVMGMATTYSASNYITCSSAAGTALSTGTKTKNHMLGMAPDSSKLKSISYKIHEAGIPVGIMTSVTIDHATPASFYGHSSARSDYYGIAAELPLSGFEYFAGGGFEGVKDERNSVKSLYDIVADNGYTVAYGLDDYNAKKVSAKKVILFQEKGKENNILPYVMDRTEKDLTLPQIVGEAVDFLGTQNGFFIMAEGGKIDWAAHSNDVAGTIFETLDMDAAIEIAYQFYLKHPNETLIVVTADHETGGVSLGRTAGYNFDLSVIPSPVGHSTGVEATVDTYMDGNIADTLSKKAMIGWTTSSHTGGAVPVFAIGAGSSNFAGRMDNTDIPRKICKSMGVQF
ncbi:MAG: alkaline phosphatase [Bacteroidales bacterium]